jgi:hypothetical protein
MFDFMRCDNSTDNTWVTIVVICKTDRLIGEGCRNARNIFGKFVYCTSVYLRSKGTVWTVTATHADTSDKTANFLLCFCEVPGGNLSRDIYYRGSSFHGFPDSFHKNFGRIPQVKLYHFLSYRFPFISHLLIPRCLAQGTGSVKENANQSLRLPHDIAYVEYNLFRCESTRFNISKVSNIVIKNK